MEKKKISNEVNKEKQFDLNISGTNSYAYLGCTPASPSFYADSGHWNLSRGVVGVR
jgi:hypothetical protein